MGSRRGAGPDPSLVEEVGRIMCDDWEGLLRIARDHGPVDQGEDCVHDAYLKVRSGKAKPKDPDEEVLAWFRRVVRNVARNRRRREAVRGHDSLEEVENHSVATHEAVVWILYKRICLYRDLRLAFRTLTDAEREVAEVRLLDGRSHREIAEARGVSVSTSRSLWRRGRAKLQAFLEQ